MLIDSFDRTINYLRVSITDKCNFRCQYCMPYGNPKLGHHSEYLSTVELIRIIKNFINLGIKKIRITGGEPLLRKDVVEIIATIAKLNGIQDLAISTNAYYLERYVQSLKVAGLNRVNVSLDSLQPNKFKIITRGGNLQRVLSALNAAKASQLLPIKLNMVVMQGVNDDEIEAMLDFALQNEYQLRFIETMPIGKAGLSVMDKHYPTQKIIERIKNYFNCTLDAVHDNISYSSVANEFIIKRDDKSQQYHNHKFGVISAVSNNFCATCNRVRLTSRGILALCLGQNSNYDLKKLIRSDISDEEIQQKLIELIAKKPERHHFNENVRNIEFKQMVSLGG